VVEQPGARECRGRAVNSSPTCRRSTAAARRQRTGGRAIRCAR
jgi:hypothetical protein